MADLQTTFYILGIVFMSLMLLLGLIAVVAVLVIRAKISSIHRHIEARLGQITEWAEKGGAVLGAIKKVSGHRQKSKK